MANILIVAHHWPGVTPMNVWEMQYDMWLVMLSGVQVLKDKEIGWWSQNA